MSEIFELFGNSESSLSNDNISRGFYLFPIIEISELTEIFESALAAMAMPGVAGMEGSAATTRLLEKRLSKFA